MNTNIYSYRGARVDDFFRICHFPQDEQELYFMFPKADYPLSPQQLEETMKQRFECITALCNDEIVGYANFYEVLKGKYCSIGNMIVNPNYRNQGVATFLIKKLEKIGIEKYNILEIRLSCFESNTKGLSLYTKLGFKPYEIEKGIHKNKAFVLIKLKKVLYNK